MNKKSIFLIFVIMAWIPCGILAVNTADTRMMQQPAISSTQIAFTYSNDLWIANLDGTNVRRLTSDAGVESNPTFSPDGKTIAFSAEYDGNIDVYTILSIGGIPQRLTWHPADDIVNGFTPDGKSVLFASRREDFSNRYFQLFTVPLSGGFPTKLVIPNGMKAAYSPDGKQIAYSPISPRFQQWKNYRGGTVSNIWIFNFDNYETVKIPMGESRSNDWVPMWVGKTIYFLSDRSGEFNLFSYSTETKDIKQLTQFNDFPIISASASGANIIFEQAGKLHIYNISANIVKILQIAIAAELLELRPRYVKGPQNIRSASVSPSGARAVFDFRGEIITVPAEKGDLRNITQSEGVHEKYPAWSPDGKNIAYFSDRSGEYQLFIQAQDGKAQARAFSLNGTGFYAYPEWSPDNKYITFNDNGRNFYLFEVATGKIKKIDSDEYYIPGAFRNLLGNWSSDSRWIAYTKVTSTQFKRIYIYSVEQGKSFAITDGLSDTDNPVFDPEGKYLLFLASTDAGPVINWFDQSNNDMRISNSIYLASLRRDILNPFARESDEETGKTNENGENEKKDDSKNVSKDKSKEKAKDPVKSISIDFEGIENRIVNVPLKAGNISQLGMVKAGEFYYVLSDEKTKSSKLFKYEVKERKESEVMELDNYRFTADGKKMLYNKGETWGITDAGKKPEAGKGVLNVAAIEVKINPCSEWKQIFDEVWRINRDYFYDPGMHGANWPAMKEKYGAFLPDLSCRNDLNRLIVWMCSELSVGHSYSGGGDQRFRTERVEGGLLGADYEIANNRYRFKKIYGGLNWNPGLRSPLTEPGINAKVGEYLLAVNGKEIKADQNLFSFFEKTAGKIVEITIGSNPDTTGSRIVKVEPIANESALRNRDWVEGNLRKVTEATNGKVAYVYVPNTASEGYEYFKRYFYPQANRDAIIIDERFNGGGSIADYYIDLLTRPFQSYWNMRYGLDLKTPSASIQGPKVMIINETAGSGGDMLPWMFHKFKVGTLVGKNTWGGLVGILDFPELMDGGFVTAPNIALWTKDGFIVENVGVAPDIEVEMWPAEVSKGHDPQLEKAIQVALDELSKNPPEKVERPPYPVRVRK
jgi:tricorn protease